jgi:hypothetical protein
MPDLATQLLHRSIGELKPTATHCGGCRRTPLPGERMHELEEGRQLCDLCFASLPDETRHAVESRRVGASERRLRIAPKAA